MNRRSFLQAAAALVGGIAIEKAIPFGRVWSFPKEIKCLNAGHIGRIGNLLKSIYESPIRAHMHERSLYLNGHWNFRPPALWDADRMMWIPNPKLDTTPSVGIIRLNGGWPKGSLTRADFA